ncbi:lipoate--protein ligase family protein [Rubrobacter tropicus]|uniref:Lipoate--protein ligase family protein n=1 Tax=Rubrobacter tropicus TaxID=2653851 RepID=A0A6G8Q4I9_9ACTN|nr:lipoate--protein ligase family protein [Rubrobacter tropicus]QIN81237.1 lipoate--protein ligase family protein [Rubrobacter tropicus]
MDLLLPGRFRDPVTASGYFRTVFEQVAAGERPATVSITPSTRHVGVTRRDTFRPGFESAVKAANDDGYPVLVRSSGGGATAADAGTFGFSIIRPAQEEVGRGIGERYDEAAALVLGAFSRVGLRDAEVGEVRDEFCPGDHSIRVGGWEGGMKLCGIAQRVTRRATSVGGIVLVEGEEELARVLAKFYGALGLPFRPESVGSARRAGNGAPVEDFLEAFAAEAEARYGAERVPLDDETLALARQNGAAHLA